MELPRRSWSFAFHALAAIICCSWIATEAKPFAETGVKDTKSDAPAVGGATEPALHRFLSTDEKKDVSLNYVWLDIAEEATARNVDTYSARPTVVARTLAIWATSFTMPGRLTMQRLWA